MCKAEQVGVVAYVRHRDRPVSQRRGQRRRFFDSTSVFRFGFSILGHQTKLANGSAQSTLDGASAHGAGGLPGGREPGGQVSDCKCVLKLGADACRAI